jgi:hypothetical protein
MAELDYYSVMQKRIDYLAKKYDPYDRYSIKKDTSKDVFLLKKPEKVRGKVAQGFGYLFSLLF